MTSELNPKSAQKILSWLARISQITNLEDLLSVVVAEMPDIVMAKGCWIYLLPDYVPEYKRFLIDENGNKISEEDVEGDYVVLAATNVASKKKYVGNAYYKESEGVTGWVFKNSKTLRVQDVTDPEELKNYAADLKWKDKYDDGIEFYKNCEQRPLLVVPLLNLSPIGVLKFHANVDGIPFSSIDEQVAVVVAQIISSVIRSTWIIGEQEQTILKLIEISNRKNVEEVAAKVTDSLKRMLSCSETQLHLRSQDGKKTTLFARNGEVGGPGTSLLYSKGDSLVEWIYKTGLPLSIPDVKRFMVEKKLTVEELSELSGEEIYDDDSLTLKWEANINPPLTARLKGGQISFSGVPVIAGDGEVVGVLCAYSTNSNNAPSLTGRRNQQLLQSFSSTIALVLENHLNHELGNLLTNLGLLAEPSSLFDEVTGKIPNLVTSLGCSIYKMTAQPDDQEYKLKLECTSRKELIGIDGKPVIITYLLGEGKTGICAETRTSIVVNHFGSNKRALQKLDKEYQRIKQDHPLDLIDRIKDDTGKDVGILQVRGAGGLRMDIRARLRFLAANTVFNKFGLPSAKLEPYTHGTGLSWSFVAVPVKKGSDLYGVITVARPSPGVPFSANDISLLESIAGRLAGAMEFIKLQEERRRMLIHIAHEIYTPLIGISADSLVLRDELPQGSELREMAGHNANIVAGLKMQSKTLMRVLSEQQFKEEFSEHSIFRPLKTACELSESQAYHKGCDIKGPMTLDRESFPKVEMVLDDLTIAFNNLVQNAVKYSFRPTVSQDKNRYIVVAGKWDKDRKNYIVMIQNYGVGITQEEIERRLIFKPFYRGEKAIDRHRTGSGVGLTYTRQVIEDMHHGVISVTSENMGGDAYLTTFLVQLPVRQPYKKETKHE